MNELRGREVAGVVERFMSKVNMTAGPDECWPFTAYVMETGYGQFWDGERLVRSHRFAFELAHGREPEGVVDHTCHNDSGCAGGPRCPHRSCCNPFHLEDVTFAENIRRGQAGRQSSPLKTHCVHGHEYTPTNQYIDPKGHQRCRSCAHTRYLQRKAA